MIIPLHVSPIDTRVHHPFVLTTPENLGLQENDLTSPLDIAHKSKGNIIRGRARTIYLNTETGQACPHSTLLFDLYLETVSMKVKQELEIKYLG